MLYRCLCTFVLIGHFKPSRPTQGPQGCRLPALHWSLLGSLQFTSKFKYLSQSLPQLHRLPRCHHAHNVHLLHQNSYSQEALVCCPSKWIPLMLGSRQLQISGLEIIYVGIRVVMVITDVGHHLQRTRRIDPWRSTLCFLFCWKSWKYSVSIKCFCSMWGFFLGDVHSTSFFHIVKSKQMHLRPSRALVWG